MGFFSGLFLTGAAIGLTTMMAKNRRANEKASKEFEEWEKELLRDMNRREEEDRKRRSIICKYDKIITRNVFEDIAFKCAKRIKRISDIKIGNGTVKATVSSQSGISEWEFVLDFNDYGKFTGSYWLERENFDSEIPERLGSMIQDATDEYIKKHTLPSEKYKKRNESL